MSEKHITAYARNEVPKGKTDWARLRAMSEEEIETNAADDADNPPLTAEALAAGEVVFPQDRNRITVYEEGSGGRLMDPTRLSSATTEFLREERQMLSSVIDRVDTLVEVGCMGGRYLDWALSHGKRYIGVDLNHRHIQAAQATIEERGLHDRAHFLTGDARHIDSVIAPAMAGLDPSRALLFFPFNSFGLIPGPSRTLRSIQASGLQFVISSYQVTSVATACRAAYYQHCGYGALSVVEDERGVWFTSTEGLRSVAYHPRYLLGLCAASGLGAAQSTWGTINQVYATPVLVEHWDAASRFSRSLPGNSNGRHLPPRRAAVESRVKRSPAPET